MLIFKHVRKMPLRIASYFGIFLALALLSGILALIWKNLVSTAANTASFIGTNISIFGVIIAVSEIYRLQSISEAISATVNETKERIFKFEDIRHTEKGIDAIKFLKMAINVGHFTYGSQLIQNVIDAYREITNPDTLEKRNSTQRKNLDNVLALQRKLERLPVSFSQEEKDNAIKQLDRIYLELSAISRNIRRDES